MGFLKCNFTKMANVSKVGFLLISAGFMLTALNIHTVYASKIFSDAEHSKLWFTAYLVYAVAFCLLLITSFGEIANGKTAKILNIIATFGALAAAILQLSSLGVRCDDNKCESSYVAFTLVYPVLALVGSVFSLLAIIRS